MNKLAAVLALVVCVPLAGCEEIAGVGRTRDTFVWWVPHQLGERGGWQGTPALEGNRLFVQIGNTVRALDTGTGAMLWETPIFQGPQSPASSNIVVRNGKLFLAESGPVLSLDAANGAILWRFRPDAQADRAESAVDDRAVYIGTRSHRVYALTVSGGEPLWSVDIGPNWEHLGVIVGLTVSGDTLYAAADRWLSGNGFLRTGVIVALDRITGRELWRYQVADGQNAVATAPTVAGRFLLASDAYGQSYLAVDRFTGREVWRNPTSRNWVGPRGAPVVADGIAYVGAADMNVYAADLETGALRWKADTRGSSIDHVVVCGDNLVAKHFGVTLLERATGRIAHRLLDDSDSGEFATSGLAVAGNRVFVTGNQATYAIDC